MPRNWLRWVIVPLVVLPLGWLLFQGLGRDPRDIPSPLVGKPLPAFAGTTLTGEHFSTASLVGRPSIINFWASFCIPSCVDEHPFLMDLAERQPGGLLVIGVMYNDTPDGARGFLARYGDGGWPNLLNADGRLSIAYGVTGPPETFFVDADGIVRARHIGPLTAAVLADTLPLIGVTP